MISIVCGGAMNVGIGTRVVTESYTLKFVSGSDLVTWNRQSQSSKLKHIDIV